MPSVNELMQQGNREGNIWKETQLPKPSIESISLTSGRKGEGWGWRNDGTCRKKSELDVNNTDIITITYNYVGDAASNASYLFFYLIRL